MRVIFTVVGEHNGEDDPEAELGVIPRVGESVFLDATHQHVEFTVQKVTHFPRGGGADPGPYVHVELS